MNRLRELLATCFYVGHIPGAPGTWGSVLAVAVFVLAGRPLGNAGWHVFLAVFLVSAFAMSRAEEVFGARDPKPIVLDEFAGQWLAILVAGNASWPALAAAFALFRLLDIAKPFPINRLERLPGWRGIIADDLAAGLAAGIIVRVALVLISSHQGVLS